MEYRRGRISLDADIYNRPTVGLFIAGCSPAPHHVGRAAQSDLARVRRYGFEEGLLPGGRDVVAETPRRRQSRLTASDLTVDLTHRPIQRVAVDGRGAGVHPEPRRLG